MSRPPSWHRPGRYDLGGHAACHHDNHDYDAATNNDDIRIRATAYHHDDNYATTNYDIHDIHDIHDAADHHGDHDATSYHGHDHDNHAIAEPFGDAPHATSVKSGSLHVNGRITVRRAD